VATLRTPTVHCANHRLQFTYHNSDSNSDEQDIEILSSYLYKTGSNGTPPGIELTVRSPSLHPPHILTSRRQNYNPTNGGGNDYRIDAFTADPAAAYHNYTFVPIEDV
jgi:hypothetical protein